MKSITMLLIVVFVAFIFLFEWFTPIINTEGRNWTLTEATNYCLASGYFFMPSAILESALVISNDAPASIKSAANILKGYYGDLIQICDGINDEVEIQSAINAIGTGRI